MHQEEHSRQVNNNQPVELENKFPQAEINRKVDIKISKIKRDIALIRFILERMQGIVNHHSQSIERYRQDTNRFFENMQQRLNIV